MPGSPFEMIAHLVEHFIAVRKIMKRPFDGSSGIITEFRIPSKIRIGDWSEVSVVYEGSVISGYFSLMIEDRTGVKQWFTDNNGVAHILIDSGKKIQTGKLSFSKGRYESKWKFTPDRPLYSGYAKAIMHMFEDTNVYPLAIQQKDIHLI